MPNLSALIDKFLFRETLTTEEKTSIRDDIGAGTPATTESVLALLDGETLVLSDVVLGDQSAVVPTTEGALIRNGESLAWAQDPDDAVMGGQIIYDESRSFGYVEIEQSSYNSTNVRRILGTIRVPGRFAENGKTLKVTGRASILCNGGSAASTTNFGFVTDERKLITGNTVGSIYGIDVSGRTGTIQFQAIYTEIAIAEVSGDPSRVFLNDGLSPQIAGLLIPSSGNVTAISGLNFEEKSYGAEVSSTPAGDDFLLYIVHDVASGAQPASGMIVIWDLTVRGA